MYVKPIKTHSITIGESITDILDCYLDIVTENSIIAVTSKMISVSQKRVISAMEVSSRNELVRQEADAFIANEYSDSDATFLTIKDSRLIPFAGVDESNGNGSYILYPKNVTQVAYEIWQYLCMRDKIDNLGIIITDSNITPLRRGVTGVTIGWFGFDPLYNYVGSADLFGRTMKLTYINNLDALAAAAVLVMGEGSESTPIAIINDVPRIKFWSKNNASPENCSTDKIAIPISEDFYAPILSAVNWVWNRKQQ